MNGLVGKSIRGYELKQSIGEGGFGTIYRAYQAVVQREVAIKIILPVYANDPEFIRRFETEAQLVARLEHLHIVPLYDYWRDPEGAYLVMRFLRGGNLQMLLERQRLDLDMTTRILTQIGSALTIAHRNEVIHRDIKPANILLDEDGNAYLSDFGIAYASGRERISDPDGAVTGTLAYLSPEQLTSGHVTPMSDIYSLGIVLYEMLVGAHPFAGSSLTEMIQKQMHTPLPFLPADLPPMLDGVIQKATHKDPEERYADALSLITDFRLLNDQSGISLAETFTPVENPYKGLRAFDEADANDFFGRAALIEHLIERLRDESPYARFLAVVGPSGSGKSSVVKAGLIPALKRGAIPGSSRWFYASMNPNIHPLEELQHALNSIASNQITTLDSILNSDANGLLRALEALLPDDPEDVLLVIDQFEEVFTQALDTEEAQQFLRMIQAAVTHPKSRMRVILTLRADFYDRPLVQPALSQLMRERTEVVIPFTPEELEEAITGPLHETGVEMEAGLIAAIVNDVSEQPGALPMLEYMLTELFDQREANLLTLQAYRRLGGTLGALASRADDIYRSLPQALQPLARQLFLRLVTLGEGTEDTRRRAFLSEVQSIAPDIQSVIDGFDQSRLLTFDRDPLTREPTVEIAHEAIIREWKRLQHWLDESRSDVRLQRLLAQEAGSWVTAGRDPSYLLREGRLAQFEEWTARANMALTPLEKTFLEASITHQRTSAAAEQERQEREIRLEQSTALRTRLLVAAVIVAVIGVGLMLFATDRAIRARDSEAEALSLRAQSASLAQASFAQRVFLQNNDTDLGLILALEANKAASPIARDTLAQIALAPGTRRLFSQPGDGLGLVDFSPDGETVLVGTYGGVALVWDVNTGETMRTLEGHTDPWIYAVDISPDGGMAATGAANGEVFLWDMATGERLHNLEGHMLDINDVLFSPDGSRLASASYDEAVIVWDTTTGEIVHRLEAGVRQLTVVFSADGETLLSGATDGSIFVWDVKTGEERQRIAAHEGEVWYLAMFPDDTRIISGAYQVEGETDLMVRDLESGEILNTLPNRAAAVNALALSADGNSALVSYADGAFVLWDLAQSQILNLFRGHENLVYGLAFSPDGKNAFSTDLDGRGRLWDLRSGAEINRLASGLHGYAAAAYVGGDSGASILTAYQDGAVMLVDAESMTEQWTEQFDDIAPIQVLKVVTSRFAIAGAENRILIGDIQTGEIIQTLTHTSQVWSLAFTPDQTRLIIGDGDYQVTVVEIETGETLQTLTAHDSEVTTAAVTAAGDLLVTGTGAGDYNTDTLILWDYPAGTPRFVISPGAVNTVGISPDGLIVASGMNNGGVLLWDSQTGEQNRSLNGHSAAVNSVSFSLDGRKLVSGANDSSMIVWDVATGMAERTFYGLEDWVRTAEFSPDGEGRLLSASNDGTVQQWRIVADAQLIDWTRANRYLRDFTCEERQLYGVEPFCP